MRRAIYLASLGEGLTSPNPLVGAVVLDKFGQIVGEGYHAKAGQQHAEVMALAQAQDSSRGGTLIVTLEPCCHHGKTPPCTELILEKGISRVVVGLKDPDQRVSGKGISLLRKAGVEVVENILSNEVASQNRSFVHRAKTGRPWGLLKCAMSVDGRIALPNGQSKWISSEESRSEVYKIRSKCDAVIIGGGTLRNDDPLLTSRGISTLEPLRVVLSSSGNLPTKARLWDTSIARTLVALGPKADRLFLKSLNKDVLKFDLFENNPKELLKELALLGCNQVLWECGPSLATLALKENFIQELVLFVSPKIIGGLPAMTPFADFGYESIDQALSFKSLTLDKVGQDFVLNMFL